MSKAKNKEVKPLQFLNSFYFKRKYNSDRELVNNDFMYVVYRDERDNQKKIMKMEQPKMTYYVVNDEEDGKYPLPYITRDKVTPITCNYNEILLDVARTLDNMSDSKAEEWYWDCMRNGKHGILKKLHQNTMIYSSDLDIQDYWKGKFLDAYKPTKNVLTKGFFDIEVDGIDYVGFPDEHLAPCPVNAVTYVDVEKMEVYTYLLRNEKNPQIQDMEDNLKAFKNKCMESFDEDFPGFNYNIYFFDYELDLITALFEDINQNKPDYMAGWNTKFDILTLINRINQLGGDPEEIICHPDFDLTTCWFQEDKRNSDPSEKNDTFHCASYTTYVDQLILYATIRKGLGKKDSYTLNAISEEELGDQKIEYSETSSISSLPYDDYEKFVLYNIKDVLLCYKLEKKLNDIDLMYQIADITRTRFNKAMKKTISIRNFFAKFCDLNGYVLGNNHNVTYGDWDKKEEDDKDNEKFEGALVANPLLNTNMGIDINGIASKFIFEMVIDFDLASLYPSIIEAFNISIRSQYGRIMIDPTEVPHIESDDIGGMYCEDLTSAQWTKIGSKWYGLPTADEMIDLVKEELGEDKDVIDLGEEE